LSFSKGGLKIRNLLMFNRTLLDKWFGAMGLRDRLGGEWWWTLNLAVHEAGDVLLGLLERLGGAMKEY
jgi:hypothetical protein